MHMFQFTYSDPFADSDMDNGVLIHELTHGLSNRLTGGGSNPRGMGEGWSDTLSWLASMKPENDRNTVRGLGFYLLRRPSVRVYPYATSLITNPLLYSNIAFSSLVHYIGTVWSTMLYEVYWNIVDSSSFSADLFQTESDAGNVYFLKIVVAGMKLQPCNPTFIAARNAILQSDALLGGKFKCEIWRGFAKRGLGVNAREELQYIDIIMYECFRCI
ncbi:peptidase M36 [Chytridium lagenaria]|nr:peptidase M36 [Chytridium lagenaria]